MLAQSMEEKQPPTLFGATETAVYNKIELPLTSGKVDKVDDRKPEANDTGWSGFGSGVTYG